LLVVFRSSLSTGASVEAVHAGLLEGLRANFEIELCAPGEEQGKEGLVLAFVASGGSENGFKEYYASLPGPLMLLTDGLANSLAASIEILSWVREMGGKAEILHGPAASITRRILELARSDKAKKALAASRIGVIGFPSDWLIASSVDFPAAKKRWGATFTEIELSVFGDYLGKVDKAEAEAAAKNFTAKASAIVEPSGADIAAAAKVYLALKRLAADRGLDAFTLKCFDILDAFKTTGCMALALLNEEGVVAGCEGDQRAIFSMLLAREATGETAFMANPALVDAEKNRVIFAHCTIAPCMTQSYKIRSHFESGIGVGIQGIVPEGNVTILKVGGPGLDRYFLSAGKIVGNLDDPRRCRTQLDIELLEDASYFLRAPLSNHHVIVRGDHTAELEAFMGAAGAERVR
jgi:L-fucose isomerase-like protein